MDIYIKEKKWGKRRKWKKNERTFEGALLLQMLGNKPSEKEMDTLSLAKLKMFIFGLWLAVSAIIAKEKDTVRVFSVKVRTFVLGLWSSISATITKRTP